MARISRRTAVCRVARLLTVAGAFSICWSLASFVPAQIRERGVGDFPELDARHDWPWWRGPLRNGVASSEPAPVRWGGAGGDNVAWRTPVPGRGHASPVVVGDRVFLATADEGTKAQSVVAFDRQQGRQLWQTEISRDGFPGQIHAKNTHASPTVASDGQRLFVSFFHHGVVQLTALDLAGKKVWQKSAGDFRPKKYEYGYAPSPILYRGTVIVAAESDVGSFLAAFDRKTGREAWRTARPANISYSTPVVAFVGGRDQLLISGGQTVTSYDPASGKRLWSAAATAAATCGTVVWDGDTVFASGGYPQSETVAIRADGSGQVLWKNNQKCYEQSMLAHAGHLYGLTDNGILFCWRAADGQEMWKQRLQGPVSASPVLAGGNVYWANERGVHYVFKPNPERLEMIAENRLGDETFASPAVSRGQLFLRVADSSGGKRQEYLVCVGR